MSPDDRVALAGRVADDSAIAAGPAARSDSTAEDVHVKCDDHALAAAVAAETGELLAGLLADPPTQQSWSLEYEADLAAHRHIVSRLRAARPDDMVLSEEGHDDPRRLGASRVWIVDPLDGSSDFGYTPNWAVHVALVADGLPVAAAVAVPGWQATYATEPVPEPIMSPVGDRLRVVVSRSRGHFEGRLLRSRLGAEVLALGSAGVKAMAVVRGEADAYVHRGGLYEWDSCAPAAVARAAGLVCCRPDGSELRFNQPDPWSTGLVIARPGVAERILGALE